MSQPKVEQETVASAAHEYVELGVSVIPVHENKKPSIPSWREYQRRLPTHEEIDQWEAEGLFHGIAIVTGQVSGLVIVDADDKDAISFCLMNGLSSPISYNTTKGRHYLFRHPGAGKRYGNNTLNGVHPKLDFRGDGGYAICPPTMMSGRVRHWSMALDIDDLPEWEGKPSLALVSEDGTFDGLDLTGIGPLGGDVWSEMEWRLDRGERVRQGERNTTLTRFAGQKVREGLAGDALLNAAVDFINRFYDEPLSREEVERTLRSVLATDIRNYPDDYDDNGNRKLSPVGFLLSARASIVDQHLATARAQQMHIWPFAPMGGSATQIYSWTGVGKSLLSMMMFHHSARGVPFGPFDVDQPVKTLVFDFENGRRTLLSRLSSMNRSFGDAGDNLMFWSPSFEGALPIDSLRTEHLDRFKSIVDYVEPDLVVIDTVLSAFPGLEVKESEAWSIHNQLIRRLRNDGVGVVVLHHGTKPDEKGYTRENGSGTQLNDIENQIKLTDLFRREDVARTKGGVCDPDRCSQMIELMNLRLPGVMPQKVTRLSYGKIRDRNPLHEEVHIAIGRDSTGHVKFVFDPEVSKRAQAKAMHLTGQSETDIAKALEIELFYVQEWIAN